MVKLTGWLRFKIGPQTLNRSAYCNCGWSEPNAYSSSYNRSRSPRRKVIYGNSSLPIPPSPNSWEYTPSRHQKYRESPLYVDVINYLKKEVPSLEGLDRNRRRQIIREAKRYVLSKESNVPSMCDRENDGALSLCILDSEIKQLLAAAHENHGHFAPELSLDFQIGRAYWPTCVSDLKRWCGSCHACQLRSKRPIKSGVQPI